MFFLKKTLFLFFKKETHYKEFNIWEKYEDKDEKIQPKSYQPPKIIGNIGQLF